MTKPAFGQATVRKFAGEVVTEPWPVSEQCLRQIREIEEALALGPMRARLNEERRARGAPF